MAIINLNVVMNEQGQVNVTGPLANKVLCYGLLEMAREIIYEHGTRDATQPKILVPQMHVDLPGNGR